MPEYDFPTYCLDKSWEKILKSLVSDAKMLKIVVIVRIMKNR